MDEPSRILPGVDVAGPIESVIGSKTLEEQRIEEKKEEGETVSPLEEQEAEERQYINQTLVGAVAGAGPTNAVVDGKSLEISQLLDKANQTTGNSEEIVSNKNVAEQATEIFVGENSRPIYDRQTGNYAGKVSADGSRVVRYTSANDLENPYINLENKLTNGNLHVRWTK